MTQPRPGPFVFVTCHPFPLSRCTRIYLFYKMIDYGGLHRSLQFYSVSNIFHSVVRSDFRSGAVNIYHTLVCLDVALCWAPTAPVQERRLSLGRNKVNNCKPSSVGVSTGQTNVQSELLSVPAITVQQVQLKAACRQSDE